MANKEDYQVKYGTPVLLSNDDLTLNRKEGVSGVMYTQTIKLKNRETTRSMCACLDCCKTYSPRKEIGVFRDDSCPDCGGKIARSGFSKSDYASVGRTGNVNYIIRPSSHQLYGNYDETGTASRLTSTYEGDLFIVYPSNKMHKASCKVETVMDMKTGEIRYTALNTENPDNPEIITSFQMADSLDNELYESPADMARTAVYLDHQNEIPNSYNIPGVLDSGQIYSDDFVKLGYIELAKRYGLESVYHSDDDNASRYKVHEETRKAQSIIDLCVRYPGVRDMVLDRLNENLMYKKEFHSASDDAKMRTDLLLKTAEDLRSIDSNIRQDLRRLPEKEQVRYYLETITYGKKAMEGKDNPLPKKMKYKVDPMKSEHDGFGDKKKLKKRFNANPILTTNTVYTAIKISPQFCKNIDYANQFFDCIDADMKGRSQREYKDDFRHTDTPNLIKNGTLVPLKHREEIAFMKQYIRSHVDRDGKGLGQVIKDWYGNSHNPDDYVTENNRGYVPDNLNMFRDCAGMYKRITSSGKIAMTRQDCLYYSVVDAKRKINRLLEDGKTQDDITDILSSDTYWGKSAKSCVGLICDDLKKNGPPAPDDFGYVGRNGKSMMQNRTPQEIHEEFVARTNAMGADDIVNVKYNYSDEQKKRFNRDIDDVHFRLAEDSLDLIRTGEEMAICVGGSGYDRDCQSKRLLICIVENKAREKVGCVELSSDGNTLKQFKSPHNGSMQPPYEDACKKWLDEIECKDKMCPDYANMGNPSYYPYGNGDFTARRLDVAANMYPDKNVIFDYYRELELCSEKEQQAQDQLGDDEPSK